MLETPGPIPAQMPTPSAEHRRLAALEGDWNGRETVAPSPWGPGGDARGRFEMRVEIDGLFLLQNYYQQQDAQIAYRAHGICGWDTRQECYAWYWVDSLGFIPPAPARGRWAGDALVLEQPTGQDGQRGRYTFQLAAPDRLHVSIQRSPDQGNSWATFLQGIYQREK